MFTATRWHGKRTDTPIDVGGGLQYDEAINCYALTYVSLGMRLRSICFNIDLTSLPAW